MSVNGDGGETGDLFAEPDGFYQADKQPTFVTHETSDGKEIRLRLVGSSPLWAGRVVSTYLENQASTLARDKNVLELGAGGGLPSLICAIYGAKQVVMTDYPDADLIYNLEHNITVNAKILRDPQRPNVVAEGYLWGAPPEKLMAHLEPPSARFDTLILADILFNHSQHNALLETVQQTLARSPTAQALVFFTPYRPWLYEKDMAFFDLAREGGFEVEKVLEDVMDQVMFPDDRGDEQMRKTVFGYALRWKDVEG